MSLSEEFQPIARGLLDELFNNLPDVVETPPPPVKNYGNFNFSRLILNISRNVQ